MKIYLVRHGESIATGSDDERPLSEKGKSDIQNLANFISPLGLSVSYILHSKKFRAQQTAKILSSSMKIEKGIETRNELDPLARVDDLLEEIYARNVDILLVGHMPFMGKLVTQFISGNEEKDMVAFKTGTMLCLEQVEGKQWVLCWMINPGLLIE